MTPARSGAHTARRVSLRRHGPHIAALTLLLLALGLGAIFVASAHTSSARASASRYGPDPAKVSAAVQAAAWPQQQHVWCGVAAVAAVADYRGAGVSQADVANALNGSSTQSAWGTPGPSGDTWGPGFVADISRDGGLDPRGHAVGLAHATHAGYHQAVDYTGPWTATSHLVADLMRSQEPIIAIVDHGAHTVLVAGVYANGDPLNLNTVTALDIWDPGVGSVDSGVQSTQERVVSLSTWLYGWSYWGGTYSENWLGSRMLDPDPAVGPYTYDPATGRNRHLWVGHYVYIRPDASGDVASGVPVDWAFNQNDALIRGLNGEVPAGYSGPSVALYTPPPPPPPTPTPRPTATPTATPVYEATPRGQPAKPTLPANEGNTALTATPTAGARPTPATGSPLSLSLQQVCFGSSCTPGAAWALSGGFLLAFALLALIGAFLLRRRNGVPAVALAPAEMPAVEQAGVNVTPERALVATGATEATGVVGGSAEESGSLAVPAPAADAARDDAAAGAAMESVESASAGDGADPSSSLARLAGTASRLDELTEGAVNEQSPERVEEQTAPAAAVTTPEDSAAAHDLTLATLAAELGSASRPGASSGASSESSSQALPPSTTSEEAEAPESVTVAPSAGELGGEQTS